MNYLEAAKYIGMSPDLLLKMQQRPTSTLRNAPPFKRELTKEGIHYKYSKRDLDRWLKTVSCRLTAGEAASLLGVMCAEIMNFPSGFYPISAARGGGSLIIHPTQNIYVFKNAKATKELMKARKAG